VYQSRVHKVYELLDIWHGFQQSAVDSVIDAERVFSPAYGPKKDILSTEGGRRSSEAMFQIRRMFVSNRLTNSQSYHKSLAQLLVSLLTRPVPQSLPTSNSKFEVRTIFTEHSSAEKHNWTSCRRNIHFLQVGMIHSADPYHDHDKNQFSNKPIFKLFNKTYIAVKLSSQVTL